MEGLYGLARGDSKSDFGGGERDACGEGRMEGGREGGEIDFMMCIE
jgi:hypothetical protein